MHATYLTKTFGRVIDGETLKRAGPQIQNFNYDELNRLTGVSGAYTQTYSYDFAGRFSSGPLGGSYTYTDTLHPHAVARVGANLFRYDADGNMTSRTITGTTYTQQYDSEGHLITVTQGANTTVFAYDGDGNRVKQVVNGVTTLFVNAQFEAISGTTSITPTSYYLFAGKRIAMRDSAGTLTFLDSDHLGGTAATTSGVVAGGSQTSKQKYYAYGTIRTTVGAVPTPYEFTGQRLDASTSLYYYGARYYDPVIGAFVQPDSIVPEPGNSQSLNRYSSVLDNPLRYNDPTGHDVGCPGQDASECGDPNAPVSPVWLFQDKPYDLNWDLERFLLAYPDYNQYADSRIDAFAAQHNWDADAIRGEITMQRFRLGQDTGEGAVRTLLPYIVGGIGGDLDENNGELPVFRIKRSTMPAIAEHISDAQAAGHPSTLTKTTQAQGEINRAAAIGSFNGIGSPDEYPFASTEQGGAGASVRGVPLREQQAQGGTLRQFYRRNNIQVGDSFTVKVEP